MLLWEELKLCNQQSGCHVVSGIYCSVRCAVDVGGWSLKSSPKKCLGYARRSCDIPSLFRGSFYEDLYPRSKQY